MGAAYAHVYIYNIYVWIWYFRRNENQKERKTDGCACAWLHLIISYTNFIHKRARTHRFSIGHFGENVQIYYRFGRFGGQNTFCCTRRFSLYFNLMTIWTICVQERTHDNHTFSFLTYKVKLISLSKMYGYYIFIYNLYLNIF